MKLNVNLEMEWELVGSRYHILYVESPSRWWVMYSSDELDDDLFEALDEFMYEEEQDEASGMYAVVDNWNDKWKNYVNVDSAY